MAGFYETLMIWLRSTGSTKGLPEMVPCWRGTAMKNVTFLKEIEDNKNRPGTKIYLERQKNEEVVCSPAEQGDAESWVVFCPEARAAC